MEPISLLDVVEAWATAKGWWSWKSPSSDPIWGKRIWGKRYINLSIGHKPWPQERPSFAICEYMTLYEDGRLVAWSFETQLVPADPKFFDVLETHLSKI